MTFNQECLKNIKTRLKLLKSRKDCKKIFLERVNDLILSNDIVLLEGIYDGIKICFKGENEIVLRLSGNELITTITEQL